MIGALYVSTITGLLVGGAVHLARVTGAWWRARRRARARRTFASVSATPIGNLAGRKR